MIVVRQSAIGSSSLPMVCITSNNEYMTLYMCDLYMISIVRKRWEWMHACMNENARYDSAQIVNNSKIDTNGTEINHH